MICQNKYTKKNKQIKKLWRKNINKYQNTYMYKKKEEEVEERV